MKNKIITFLLIALVPTFSLIIAVTNLYKITNKPPKVADAKIVGFYEHTEYDSDGDPYTAYNAIYEFIDSNGVNHRVTSDLSQKRKIGDINDTTIIRYNPDNPENGWIPENEIKYHIILIIIGFIAFGISTFFIYRWYKV